MFILYFSFTMSLTTFFYNLYSIIVQKLSSPKKNLEILILRYRNIRVEKPEYGQYNVVSCVF